MSLLQQLVANVSVEEPEYNKCRITSWSVEDNMIKVDYERDVLLYDYFYYEEDREVEFASIEFTVSCNSIFYLRSEDVKLGRLCQIENDNTNYNQIIDIKVETDVSYDEKKLLEELMDVMADSKGPNPDIDMPRPYALVKFVELT